MDINDYMNQVKKSGTKPDTPFAHGAYLIDIEKTSIQEFNQIINRQVYLANLGGDNLVRLYQNDVVYLVAMFSQCKQNRGNYKLFNFIYTSWMGELALTRAKDGTERKLQGQIGGGYNPTNLGSYGSDGMMYDNMPEQNSGGGLNGLIKKIKGGR